MHKQPAKGGKSTPTTKFERGFTAQAPGDTQEPRISKRLNKGRKR